MKWLITIFGGLLFGSLAAYLAQRDVGYVLIGYGQYTVEMNLFIAAFFIFLLYLLLGFVLGLYRTTQHAPAAFREWQEKRTSKKNRMALIHGLTHLAEGQWGAAEKTLIKNAEKSETPLLNYLSAARAAQQQGAHDRRDDYIRRAHAAMPQAMVAVGLTHAELQLSHGQYEQALATLDRLKANAPNHTHVLKLLMQLYEQVGDWEHLREILPQLEKRKIVDEEQSAKLKQKLYAELMKNAANARDVDELHRLWKAMPKSVRQKDEMLLHYTGYLSQLNESAEAEKLLRDAIKENWQPAFVRAYGLLEGADYEQQLQQAENWLKQREQDADLLLTLGRLAIRLSLWGKARSYLEASIAIREDLEAVQALAKLLDQLGEPGEAGKYYRKGLELTKTPGQFPALIEAKANPHPADQPQTQTHR